MCRTNVISISKRTQSLVAAKLFAENGAEGIGQIALPETISLPLIRLLLGQTDERTGLSEVVLEFRALRIRRGQFFQGRIKDRLATHVGEKQDMLERGFIQGKALEERHHFKEIVVW